MYGIENILTDRVRTETGAHFLAIQRGTTMLHSFMWAAGREPSHQHWPLPSPCPHWHERVIELAYEIRAEWRQAHGVQP